MHFYSSFLNEHNPNYPEGIRITRFSDDHKAVVGGPAGPALAGPLFLAENGFGRTTIFNYSAENVFAFSTVLKFGGSIDIKRARWRVNLPEGVKDGRYKNNHDNDTCITKQQTNKQTNCGAVWRSR